MIQVETYIRNLYQQSFMYYQDHQRGNLVDKHQAHFAAQLVKDTSDYIPNISSDQLKSFKNNLLYITSMLPMSNTRPERQLDSHVWIGGHFIQPV
jgi:hypothetical protein